MKKHGNPREIVTDKLAAYGAALNVLGAKHLQNTAVHCSIYNHFNHERHLETKQVYKQKRAAALIEWRYTCAA